MKKKILTKHILMALAMASLFPLGAGASVEFKDDTLILNSYAVTNENGEVAFRDQLKSDPDQNVTYTDTETNEKKAGNSFKNIVVNVDEHTYEGHRGNDPYSFRFNGENQNITINVHGSGSATNNDALHLTNWNPHFVANSFTAYVDSPIADAINISHDATTAYVKVNNLKVEVHQGNGIRANASKYENNTNTITVDSKADITITGDGNTAVWAGDSKAYFFIMGEETLGNGEVYLKGDTNIILNGNNNYGIWAGKMEISGLKI